MIEGEDNCEGGEGFGARILGSRGGGPGGFQGRRHRGINSDGEKVGAAAHRIFGLLLV